jgi:hypothetical protein
MEITKHMKLYTEEQMHSVILLALGRHGIYIPNKHYQDLIDLITPIELPSDEEIEAELQNSMLSFEHEKGTIYSKAFTEFFNKGAKSMRDKIQGGNR